MSVVGRTALRRAWCLTGLLALSGPESAAAQEQIRALAVAHEVERLAAGRALWPGYDPLAIPLAVFDGERTYLFRHPAPPEGFSSAAGAVPPAYTYQGRHPAMTANSSAEIGGIKTATILADDPHAPRPAAELAAVALHEAFHVYQRERHPGWSAHEGDLLLYPTGDARLLALRRLESEALRRALAAADSAGAACWTRRALSFRGQRFAAMDSAFATYERLTELNEGLATYVQLVAAGRTTVEIPPAEWHPTEVRLRIYAIGPALALLLDRFRPGWQAALEADDRRYLDQMLEESVRDAGGRLPEQCGFSAEETTDLERVARRDASTLAAGRAERQQAFDARTGWRVIIQAAEGQPLWPQSFDPLNIQQVRRGLLHTRLLGLANQSGQMRAIDEAGADMEALTEGGGPHPLESGVSRVVVAGLPKPAVQTENGSVVLRGPGLTAEFRNATVRQTGMEIFIELKPAR